MTTISEQSGIVLLKDREWASIDGELCLIKDFSPMLGSSVKDGVVISSGAHAPYASVSIQCKKGGLITGFITHKMDFTNLWAVFRERVISEDEEVLMFWTTKHYKNKIYQAMSAAMPKLIVMICPKGIYKSCEENPDGLRLLPDEKVLVFVYGLKSVQWWLPDVIE